MLSDSQYNEQQLNGKLAMFDSMLEDILTGNLLTNPGKLGRPLIGNFYLDGLISLFEL